MTKHSISFVRGFAIITELKSPSSIDSNSYETIKISTRELLELMKPAIDNPDKFDD